MGSVVRTIRSIDMDGTHLLGQTALLRRRIVRACPLEIPQRPRIDGCVLIKVTEVSAQVVLVARFTLSVLVPPGLPLSSTALEEQIGSPIRRRDERRHGVARQLEGKESPKTWVIIYLTNPLTAMIVDASKRQASSW